LGALPGVDLVALALLGLGLGALLGLDLGPLAPLLLGLGLQLLELLALLLRGTALAPAERRVSLGFRAREERRSLVVALRRLVGLEARDVLGLEPCRFL